MIKRYIYIEFKKWFVALFKKIYQDPIKNGFLLFVSAIIIYAIGNEIGAKFGFFSLIGYAFLCVYNLVKIIDDIRRPLAWGVGYIIATIAFGMIPEFILPLLGNITLVSLFSLSIISYVIIQFILIGEKMKKY